MKFCSNKNCNQNNPQPVDSFNIDKSRKTGLSDRCKYCKKEHRDTPKAKENMKRLNHLPKAIKNRKELSKTPEYAVYQKEYRATPNATLARKERRQTIKEKQRIKEWEQQDRKENPGKYTAKHNKRRAAKLKRMPPWLSSDQFIKMNDIYVLKNSLSIKHNEKYEVDHIIPLQGENVSGLHVPWNLQILNKFENLKKSNSFDGTYDNNGWRNG